MGGRKRALADADAKQRELDAIAIKAAAELQSAATTVIESEKDLAAKQAVFEARLIELGMAEADYRTAIPDIAAIAELEEAIAGFDTAIAEARARDTIAKDAVSNAQRQSLEPYRLSCVQTQAAADDAVKQSAAAQQRHQSLVELQASLADQLENLRALEQFSGPLRGIVEAFDGQNEMRTSLETFAIGAIFDEVLEAANLRLDPMPLGLDHRLGPSGRATPGGAALDAGAGGLSEDVEIVLAFARRSAVGVAALFGLKDVPTDQLLDVVQDGVLLNPADKDSVRHAISYWIVELGELDATFRRADMAALKAFVPKEADRLRLPYARTESHYARRTVFFGSVNPRSFLNDPTGNTRYWTIECTSIDLEAQRALDMQQIWAEVHVLWEHGVPWLLTGEEIAALKGHNEEYRSADPIEERIQVKLDWEATLGLWRWNAATETLLEIGLDKPTAGDAAKASAMIRKLNGAQSRRYQGKNQSLVPPTVCVDFYAAQVETPF